MNVCLLDKEFFIFDLVVSINDILNSVNYFLIWVLKDILQFVTATKPFKLLAWHELIDYFKYCF